MRSTLKANSFIYELTHLRREARWKWKSCSPWKCLHLPKCQYKYIVKKPLDRTSSLVKKRNVQSSTVSKNEMSIIFNLNGYISAVSFFASILYRSKLLKRKYLIRLKQILGLKRQIPFLKGYKEANRKVVSLGKNCGKTLRCLRKL